MLLKIILTTTAIALSAPASAQSSSRAELLDGCGLMANLAEHIMGARQRRVPLAKALDAASQVADKYSVPWSPLRDQTLQAYEWPVGLSELARQQAIADFADAAMLQCMKTLD